MNINVTDIFTKQLSTVLFRQHCDYLIGRVPLQYSSMYPEVAETYKREPGDKGKVDRVLDWTAAAAAKVQARVTNAQVKCWTRITQHWASECKMK